MWLGIGSVANGSIDDHRSEVERAKGSRIAEPIFPTSAANLPVVAAGSRAPVGPQSGPSRAPGPRGQNHSRGCHFSAMLDVGCIQEEEINT